MFGQTKKKPAAMRAWQLRRRAAPGPARAARAANQGPAGATQPSSFNEIAGCGPPPPSPPPGPAPCGPGGQPTDVPQRSRAGGD